MPGIQLEETSQKVQDLYQKGFAAFERNNHDYAIDMFASCVEIEPLFVKAREFLRVAEIRKFQAAGGGAMAHAAAGAKGIPLLMKGAGQIKRGKATDAITTAEKLLRIDPLHKKFAVFLADAAEAAEMPEVAVHTLSSVREQNPDDAEILDRLGDLYTAAGMMRDARQCFDQLCKMRPDDLDAVKKLKDSMARDSLVTDGWEGAGQKGDYRKLMKNAEEAEALERESKMIRSSKDNSALLQETLDKVEKDPLNMNHRRALARVYRDAEQHEEAIQALDDALEASGGDPQIENMIIEIYLEIFDGQIAELEAAGDTETAAQRKAERDQYEHDTIVDRVSRYPNDLELRYQLGAILQGNGQVDEAIREFQLAQRSPKRRIEAIFGLATCFKAKGQMDLAKDQIKTAVAEMPSMNEMKKQVLYELGEICDAMGDKPEAAEYYKQIYAADIGFRDISDKIARLYD